MDRHGPFKQLEMLVVKATTEDGRRQMQHCVNLHVLVIEFGLLLITNRASLPVHLSFTLVPVDCKTVLSYQTFKPLQNTAKEQHPILLTHYLIYSGAMNTL